MPGTRPHHYTTHTGVTDEGRGNRAILGEDNAVASHHGLEERDAGSRGPGRVSSTGSDERRGKNKQCTLDAHVRLCLHPFGQGEGASESEGASH